MQRILKFAKYLPQYGWKPVILTAQPQDFAMLDPTLMAEIPDETPIYPVADKGLPAWLPWRLRYFFSQWFLFSDPQLRWGADAIKMGHQAIQDHEIKAILSTAPPYTSHLVGLTLSRQTGLPWLADYRDLWTCNSAVRFATAWHRRKTESVEQEIFRASSLITVVSQPMKKSIESGFQHSTDKIRVITNGFDPADFPPLDEQPPSNDQFRLVYSGALYGAQRSLTPLLAGIRLAIDSKRVPENQFRLILVGSISSDLKAEIDRAGLENLVSCLGYQSHQESLLQIRSADALLLVIGEAPGSEGIFTGKIFEYLAARKPVLALAPPGVAADLIIAATAGMVAHPKDVQAIANCLVELFDHWRNGTQWKAFNQEVIHRYSRVRLTAQLAGYLDEITRGSQVPLSTRNVDR